MSTLIIKKIAGTYIERTEILVQTGMHDILWPQQEQQNIHGILILSLPLLITSCELTASSFVISI